MSKQTGIIVGLMVILVAGVIAFTGARAALSRNASRSHTMMPGGVPQMSGNQPPAGVAS